MRLSLGHDKTCASLCDEKGCYQEWRKEKRGETGEIKKEKER